MRILRVLLGNLVVKLGLPVYGVQLHSRELHAVLRGAVRDVRLVTVTCRKLPLI